MSCALFLFCGFLIDADLVDDSYIFLRYARNAAAGDGLVFNAGERVEGYTSPLWMSILTAATTMGWNPVAFCKIASIGLGLSSVILLLVTVTLRLPPALKPLGLVPAFFLATNPSFIFWAWSGMETALVSLLILTSFSLTLKIPRRSSASLAAGLFFFLAALTRPEAIALLPLFLFFIFFSVRPAQRFRQLHLFLIPALLLLAHEAWRFFYYGALLPNTFHSKAVASFFSSITEGIKYSGEFALIYQLPAMSLYIAGAVFLNRSRSWRLELCFSSAIVISWIAIVSLMGGDHFPMHRFFTPALSIFGYLVTVSSIPWLHRLGGPRPALISCWLVLIAAAVNLSVYIYHGGSRAREEVALARSWSAVGKWLADNVDHDCTIAAVPMGAIPYYSRLTAIDLLGLTDREIAVRGKVDPDGRQGHQRYLTDYVLKRRPDLILFQSSGLFEYPRHSPKGGEAMSYPKAFVDLVCDPRVQTRYEYRSIRMENGQVIELLCLPQTRACCPEGVGSAWSSSGCP